MGEPCSGGCGKRPADRHQSLVRQAERKPLTVYPNAGDCGLGDPPTAMNLRAQLRVEQGYRIGHPH
jgi:hypothetical protein